jgi:hypothetical protein
MASTEEATPNPKAIKRTAPLKVKIDLAQEETRSLRDRSSPEQSGISRLRIGKGRVMAIGHETWGFKA